MRKPRADFQKAAEIDPRQTLSQVGQGKIAEETGNFDEALEKVQSKLVRNPNDAFLFYTQSEILVQKGVQPGTHDFQVALESARKAVTIDPKACTGTATFSVRCISAPVRRKRRQSKQDWCSKMIQTTNPRFTT